MANKICSSLPHATFMLSLRLIILLALVSCSNAGCIVIYWGQNEAEGSLKDICYTGRFRFSQEFGDGNKPELNLAGHCDPASNSCQGVEPILSFFRGRRQERRRLHMEQLLERAVEFQALGDAVLDSVDFNIEQGEVTQYGTLARRLSRYSRTGKKVYLIATPQCPFPDQYLDDALSTGLFNYIWIQFYNNYCRNDDPNAFKAAWSRSIKAIAFHVGGSRRRKQLLVAVLSQPMFSFLKCCRSLRAHALSMEELCFGTSTIMTSLNVVPR
ncbi:1,4-alpha-glucan-branching enzyme [Parasponia andersonii]|uniref:chitinase n=1 Tax=Parasponia andersonii TaxID=3476 RepID=A0A2P5BLC0_PARAD|nr:1,4-alpha-glucan-branching enzyme [Parasponia andersonii]